MNMQNLHVYGDFYEEIGDWHKATYIRRRQRGKTIVGNAYCGWINKDFIFYDYAWNGCGEGFGGDIYHFSSNNGPEWTGYNYLSHRGGIRNDYARIGGAS